MNANAKGATLHVEARGTIAVAPAALYKLIAEYHTGHPSIVPPKYFRRMKVTKGGYGEGTEIEFEMMAFGLPFLAQKARARITEPEPGRVLVETDMDRGVVTTFVVEPAGLTSTCLTMSTVYPLTSGPFAPVERAVVRAFLRKVYVAELLRIGEVTNAKVSAVEA